MLKKNIFQQKATSKAPMIEHDWAHIAQDVEFKLIFFG